MTIEFREPKRENAPLLIGLSAGSGGGKTYSACLIARGLANGQPFAFIDTENGRGLHYADYFPDMRHARLDEPFSPERYIEAIKDADAAGFPVIVIDSASHEYEGEGGVLRMQEAEFKRLGSREATKMLSWAAPKQAHKAYVRQLLRTKAHVILCMRAEDKIEIVDKQGGGKEVVPKKSLIGIEGWIPIMEKRLPFELTLSLLLTPDKPGYPKPVKLQEQHRAFVPLDKPLSEETGKQLAAWAAGTSVSESGPSTGTPSGSPVAAEPVAAATSPDSDSPTASPAQKKKLDILVAQLRKAEKINASQLWRSTHREPVASEDGEVHWSPLRDSLSKDEASALIERLSKYAENLGVAA